MKVPLPSAMVVPSAFLFATSAGFAAPDTGRFDCLPGRKGTWNESEKLPPVSLTS